ncbi:MAG: NAD(P)/FAD-dependent oxidoreductase [Variibacter sp.]|nr:NAD(P)/FAD-dependent oxidoreductase [Variibacter sp.]
MTDVVIIGGGHNGLTCGAYLAKAGLDVTVLEAGPTLGGGTRTQQLTAPGFLHNLCANFFIGLDASPVPRDLKLKDYGFEFLIPDVQQAFIYDDRTALIVEQDLDATISSVAKFSAADAATWKQLHQRLWRARPLFVRLAYNLLSEGQAISAAAVSQGILTQALLEELQAVRPMSPFAVIDRYFEDERIRVVFKKLVHVIQATDSQNFGSLFFGLFINLTRMCLPVRGSQTLPEALGKVIVAEGGTLRTGDQVRRILVDGGQATGVELENGEVIEANEAVICGIDFPQMTRMAGEEHFPEDVVKKAKDWDWISALSLVTLHLALSEAPAYAAAEFDPKVMQAWNITFGVNNAAELHRSMSEIGKGAFPSLPAGNGACNSLLDPTYAPNGQHSAFWWPFAPFVVDGSESNWERKKEEYTKRLLMRWRDFAPNLTEKTIIASHLRTPLDIARENPSMPFGSVRMGGYTAEQFGLTRPHPQMADYRVPWIQRLYHCASTSPSGGGVNCAPGYNAARIIAEDLGVDPWWPRMTLAYAAELANQPSIRAG